MRRAMAGMMKVIGPIFIRLTARMAMNTGMKRSMPQALTAKAAAAVNSRGGFVSIWARDESIDQKLQKPSSNIQKNFKIQVSSKYACLHRAVADSGDLAQAKLARPHRILRFGASLELGSWCLEFRFM